MPDPPPWLRLGGLRSRPRFQFCGFDYGLAYVEDNLALVFSRERKRSD